MLHGYLLPLRGLFAFLYITLLTHPLQLGDIARKLVGHPFSWLGISLSEAIEQR